MAKKNYFCENETIYITMKYYHIIVSMDHIFN